MEDLDLVQEVPDSKLDTHLLYSLRYHPAPEIPQKYQGAYYLKMVGLKAVTCLCTVLPMCLKVSSRNAGSIAFSLPNAFGRTAILILDAKGLQQHTLDYRQGAYSISLLWPRQH